MKQDVSAELGLLPSSGGPHGRWPLQLLSRRPPPQPRWPPFIHIAPRSPDGAFWEHSAVLGAGDTAPEDGSGPRLRELTGERRDLPEIKYMEELQCVLSTLNETH